MNPDLIAEIQKFTLDARHILEREAAEQLEGLYGWLPDGSFAPVAQYPALGLMPEAAETRKKLESYAEAEKEAGNNPQTVRQTLVRETAFTWLNRFVALKMMEERRLIKETISRLIDSNAYKLWIADEIDPEATRLYEKGDLPTDALGEGPRHRAYRRFIVWECGRLSRDVSVLFDSTNIPSRLFPRPSILKQIIDGLNAPNLAEAWRPGNEESIGWVYQGFNADELQAAFAKAREQGKKFEPRDIPAVTQLFTIHWVVKFLVENTLGRLWAEMHPDSRLIPKLEYLVPIEGKYRRTLKPVRDITFLDPACGSMHFGLVAFNLFAKMYHEEIDNAGKSGWPEVPSVCNPAEIPSAIIKNNIYGLDIDLRAVQISALTLYLRARTMNPKCAFSDDNLACANVEHITAGRLQEFIREAKFEHPIFERILLAMADRLKDSNNLGSLLRLEEDLQALIIEERKKARVEPQMALRFPEISQEKFQTQEGMEEFFGLLEEKIFDRLDEFVKRTRESGLDSAYFAAEAAKGLRFLRLAQHRYDIVTTNPPYLSNRKMNKRLADLLSREYPDGKSDLYAAFIRRCLELSNADGLIGMLTMHSFMFISSYEELRKRLRSEAKIDTLAHFGGGLFAVGNPGTLQTAAYILSREENEEKRQNSIGTYFRLVHERDAEAKREVFESALKALREGRPHAKVFRYKQKDFDAIPGQPWVYWMPENLRKLFIKLARIREVAEPKQGLATADNTRFLRAWWEVGCSRIGFGTENREEAKNSGKKWFPYMKGGKPTAWFGNQQFVVNWNNDGAEIKQEIIIRYPYLKGKWEWVAKNTDYYFRRGVTWSDISSKGFAARLSPGGFIHDVSGMTCFPKEEDIAIILGVLNSRVAKYILSALNPTIHFQVGDIERLPVPEERNERIVELVNKCIELAKQDSRESEITYDFIRPLSSIEEYKARKAEVARLEAEIDREVSKLYGLSENDLEFIERELSAASGEVAVDDSESSAEAAEEDELSNQALSPTDWALSWISYAAGIAFGRFEVGKADGLGRGDFSPEVGRKLQDYISKDGLLVNDSWQPLDLAGRCLKILEVLLGEKEAAQRIKIAFGEGDSLEPLQVWFNRFTGLPKDSFWKYHFQLYRKRPVYWPFQSPDRRYTIWVFHERLTRDTLFQIKNDIVEPRLRMVERTIADLRLQAQKDRPAQKELDRLLELRDDLAEFSKRLRAVGERGYGPHIDDGVLLNAAPLHELLPSWPETKKAWADLEKGEYDWAQQAMEFWPERVREKCRTNRSLAIAHGLEELCEVPDNSKEKERGKRGRRKAGSLEV
jgi:hypothetical protein